MKSPIHDVRFTPDNGHRSISNLCPLSANSGYTRHQNLFAADNSRRRSVAQKPNKETPRNHCSKIPCTPRCAPYSRKYACKTYYSHRTWSTLARRNRCQSESDSRKHCQPGSVQRSDRQYNVVASLPRTGSRQGGDRRPIAIWIGPTRLSDLPAEWHRQYEALGLPAP